MEGDRGRRAAAVSDFSDVERFARAHAACGGITPKATTQAGGGYLLTLTCACGAGMDRVITAEEARLPLPLPSKAAPLTKPSERPKPAPSDDVQEALRRAVEAPRPSVVKASSAPAERPSPSADLEEALRQAVEAEPSRTKPAPSPPPSPAVSITNLDEAVQRALEADAREAAAAAAARPRVRAVTPRLNVDATVKRAMDAQKAARSAPRADTSRFWFGAVVVVLALGGVALWLGLHALDEDTRLAPRDETAAVVAAGTTAAADRAAFADVMRALKDIQTVSTPTAPYSIYSSRVAFAKAPVQHYMSSRAAPELTSGVRDTMDLHLLAMTAWRARTLESREAWEAVGRDPALDLCPGARQAVDGADTAPGQSRPHARGVAVAAAIPQLWECAATRLSDLERASSR
jgi:hypothetical protein